MLPVAGRLLAGALLLLPLAACTSTPGRITVLCGGTEQWCFMMTTRFTEDTGIRADFVRMSSGEALKLIRDAKDAPQYDVWHGGPADAYAAAAREKLLEPYRSPLAGQIREGWSDPGGAWSGVYGGILAFCNNVAELGRRGLGPVRSWAELLDPRLAKSVGIAHPATSGTAYTTLWTQVELWGSEDGALAYMRRLNANVMTYNRAGAEAAAQAARGEVAVGVSFSHDCVEQQRQGFTGLEVTFPVEGSGYEIGGVAVLAGALNGDEARAYVDWALSGDSQRVGPMAGFFALPANTGVAPDSRSADLASVPLIRYDVDQAGRAKSALSARFSAEIAPEP